MLPLIINCVIWFSFHHYHHRVHIFLLIFHRILDASESVSCLTGNCLSCKTSSNIIWVETHVLRVGVPFCFIIRVDVGQCKDVSGAVIGTCCLESFDFLFLFLEIMDAEEAEVVLTTGTGKYASEVTKTNWAVEFVPVSRFSIFWQVFTELYVFFLILGCHLNVTFLHWLNWNVSFFFIVFFIVWSTLRIPLLSSMPCIITSIVMERWSPQVTICSITEVFSFRSNSWWECTCQFSDRSSILNCSSYIFRPISLCSLLSTCFRFRTA